ncbi:MAG: glycosyltransferase family 9 protein [Pyrinomonadaceae bacterium]
MQIDWQSVKRVLVIRLRSIGDTVLATPSLIALRRFLPDAEIDILLEDWVAPLLDGIDAASKVISIPTGTRARAAAAWRIRQNNYDVAINFHGGTTGTFFTVASGAKHRVGYTEYQYSFLYNHLLTSAADFWRQKSTHSAEQQLALLGFVGVPVEDRPKSKLDVTEAAFYSTKQKIGEIGAEYALLHPAAAFATKRWATENFARIAEFLAEQGISTIAVAAGHERAVLDKLQIEAKVPIMVFDDLSLPEITALSKTARIFVGNDSGIAHIAAAVQTPTVVIFGSSNRDHWRPWTDAPNEIVFEQFPCQPCPGTECKEFGDPRCILTVSVLAVIGAIERQLEKGGS